jgi:hypothetical protein
MRSFRIASVDPSVFTRIASGVRSRMRPTNSVPSVVWMRSAFTMISSRVRST